MADTISDALQAAHNLIVNVPFDGENLEWANAVDAKIQAALAALPKGEPVSEVEVENALEDAAKAAFTQAQSVYRSEHDHFPLKHTWETTYESVREGWRKIAHAAVEAAAMPPVGTQPEPRRPRPIRSALVAAPPAGDDNNG